MDFRFHPFSVRPLWVQSKQEKLLYLILGVMMLFVFFGILYQDILSRCDSYGQTVWNIHFYERND